MLSRDQAEQVDVLAGMTLDAMVMDLITTLSIDAHQEIQRSRAICARCNTRCRDRSQLPAPNALLPSSSASSTLSASNLGTALALSASNAHHTGPHNSLANSTSNSKSRSATPQPGPDGTLGIGMNSQGNIVAGGNGGMMIKNGTIYFDCLVCSRSIASNRYAPHLASCLGLTGASRRGTSRAAAVNGMNKTKLASERSTPSPYVDFDSEGSDVGSVGTGAGGSRKTRTGDYYSPSGSTGPAGGIKKAKVIHTYGVPGTSKARGVSPTNSTTSSHPLAQSALPPPPPRTATPSRHVSPSPLKLRHEGDEVMSEDAEGEDDDAEGEGDEEYAQGAMSPAGVSGDDDDWQGSSMSED
ncbi:hypothetical protein QFC21_002997 [Naganishia friedmannii]|uniref:Uncharacterized protein n=1 Tax=Naganishia friedmannii TaxID=89922 RepID=A0ACC2VVG4_9TREE|nr:hypothetical protein QFC21_002997 [Naganishia friedmannii]